MSGAAPTAEETPMADQEPRYRPRRAWIEPEETPAGPASSTPPPAPSSPPASGPAAATAPPSAPPPLFDDELPKPLYRDELPAAPVTERSPAGSDLPPVPPAAPPASAAGPPADPLADTATRALNFAPRRRPSGPEETTILPRAGATVRRPPLREELDDEDDDEEPTGLGARARLILLVAAVTAIVLIGAGVIYAVSKSQQPTGSPTPGGVTSIVSSPPATSASPTPSPTGGLLSEASLLTAEQASVLDDKRTWKVKLTQPTPTTKSPEAACLGGDPAEGQPTAAQQLVRTLTSSGKKSPGALHQALAYETTEEAVQAYAVTAKTLGTCDAAGSYLVSGHTITKLGDQAVGTVVATTDGDTTDNHVVLLNRTGKVLNILDVSSPKAATSVKDAATALSAVTTAECGTSGGTCPKKVKVADGPPPLGGDQPGFLAVGDLPPAGKTPVSWAATDPELPKELFEGSGCETVNWSTLAAEAKSARVYLLPDSGNNVFGLNEIVLTLKSDKAAGDLVDKLKGDLGTCKERRLTATVGTPQQVSAVGAQKTEVTGYAAEVTQKAGNGTVRYRVGFVAAGEKVAYTFLNPQKGFDFTDDEWDTVAVRAGQRTTQVN